MKKSAFVVAVLSAAAFNAHAAVGTGAVRVTASFTPNLVSSGASTTFTWSATGGAICDIDGLPEGPISGPASGSRTFAVYAPVTATVFCENWDMAGSKTATVNVSNSAPTVTASFSPATVYIGGTGSTLSWKAPLATSCSSPELGGLAAPSGSVVVAPAGATSQNTYTVTCSNAFGSHSASATLNTQPKPIAPPQFAGWASPSFMWGAGWATIGFYSNDTPGCTYSYMTYVSWSSSFFGQCSNAGGTSTAWVFVSVHQPITYSKVPTYKAVAKDGKMAPMAINAPQPNLKHLGIDLSKKRYASAIADMNNDGTLDVMVTDIAKSKAYIVLNTAGQYAIAKTVDEVSSIAQIKEVFIPKSNDPAAIRVVVEPQQPQQ